MSLDSGRLTALTDGVVAVIITMVLGLKPPIERISAAWPACGRVPELYLKLRVCGNLLDTHHHFFKLVLRVNGLVMWAISTFCSGCR